MIVKDLDELQNIKWKYRDKIIVYCSGCFDLLHLGHILFFEECKKYGDILVVAVGNDSLVRGLKGASRPIFNEKIRIKMVDSLRMVDYSIMDSRPYEEERSDIKFIYDDIPILEKLKPDRWMICDDVPTSENLIKREFASISGIELIVLKRPYPKEFENISSTNIIRKIKALG